MIAIGDLLSKLRAFTVDLGVIAISVFIVLLVVSEITRDPIVVDPIEIPTSLAAAGYSAEGVARRLIGAFKEVRQIAVTEIQDPEVVLQSEEFDFVVPGAGFSVRSMLQYMRNLLGIRQRIIYGRLVLQDGKLHLFLETSFPGYVEPIMLSQTLTKQDTSAAVEKLLHRAAELLMEGTRPYVAASYCYAVNSRALSAAAEVQPAQTGDEASDNFCSDVRLRDLIGAAEASDDFESKVWSLLLDGRLWLDREQFDSARSEFNYVLRYLDQSVAYTSFTVVLRTIAIWPELLRTQDAPHRLAKAASYKFIGDTDLSEAEAIKNASPDSGDRAPSVHSVCRLLDEAEDAYRSALRFDRDMASAYNGLAKVARERSRVAQCLGRADSAEAQRRAARNYAEQAIKADSAYVWSYNFIGNLELSDGELPAAEDYFRRASKIDPLSPIPWYNLAKVLSKQDECELGLDHYRRAGYLNKNRPELSDEEIRRIEEQLGPGGCAGSDAREADEAAAGGAGERARGAM